MRKLIVGAAAAAMVAGSTIAQAAPIAAPVADARVGSAAGEADGLHGGTLWLALLAVGLLGFVLWQINDNDADNGFPVSP